MRQLTTDTLHDLLKDREPPCLSLYQPTHRANPDNLQDPIRYKNLLRDMEESLREKYRGREIRSLLEPLQKLADDYYFWTHQRDGLAILRSADTFDVFRLQRPVKEIVVVADSFHLKPLLRIVQSADRFQVLCLERQEVRLFEGNRDTLDEMDVEDMPTTAAEVLAKEPAEARQAVGAHAKSPGRGPVPHGVPGSFPGLVDKEEEIDKETERFFHVIDREVLDRFSRPSGLPLILVGLPKLQAEFRRISRNPYLHAEGIDKHPGSLNPEELRKEVWRIVEPQYLARLARLTEDYHAAAASGMAASELIDVAKATAAKRIGVLLVDADRIVPGRLDPATGAVQFGQLDDPHVDDLLDDIAEEVLRAGGEVVIVPAERMPTSTGLAATFRL